MKSSRWRDCGWPRRSIARWAKRLCRAQMEHIQSSEEAQLLNLKLRLSHIARVVVGGMAFTFLLGSPASVGQGKSGAAQAQDLPTGMSITPMAARGSTFQALNPDLPELPKFTVDHPISTAVSPDGGTLLILTSGYNRNNDARAKAIPAQTSEYVFVFDVKGKAPVKQQVLRVPSTFAGLAWSPDGAAFYVSGGQDDSVHIFT